MSSSSEQELEKIISHYAEQLEFKSPLVVERYSDPDGIIYDREKLKEYFLIGLTNNPALSFKLNRVLLGVNCLTLYYQNARGGETADLFEFDKNNKVIRSVSCYSSSSISQ
jgi:hypothetical protein